MSNMLRDALYNTSRCATLGLQRQQQYARGLVTGVMSVLMSAQGLSFLQARDIVQTNLPNDVDRAAVPSFILDLSETCPPSELFPKERSTFDLKPGVTEVSDDYRELCDIFMPQVITDVSLVVRAKQAVATATNFKPRGQRGAAVETYIVLVKKLIKDFFAETFDEFERDGSFADKDVLAVLVQSKSLTLSDVAMKTGLSETYLNLVLSGQRSLSRIAISALSHVYQVKPGIFSRAANLGMLRGQFKVTSRHNCYAITDTRSSRTYEIGDGVDSVKLDPDDPSDEASVPDCFGFTEAWERDFNSDVAQTMEAYFESKEEEEDFDDEDDEDDTEHADDGADDDEDDDEDEVDTTTVEEPFEPEHGAAALAEARSAGVIPVEPLQSDPTQVEQTISVDLLLNNSSLEHVTVEVPKAELSDRQIGILLYSLRKLQHNMFRRGSPDLRSYGLVDAPGLMEIDELCHLINLT